MRRIGKQVGDDLYVHVSAVDGLADDEYRARIRAAIDALPSDASGRVNVAKVNVRTTRMSLLEYAAFDEDPFPVLANSWSRPKGSELVLRSYADSLNPPVLHRKELLVSTEHPSYARWSAITQTAESLGLFDEPGAIGFQLNWQRAIAAKGYVLVGDEFLPLGNAVDAVSTDLADSGAPAVPPEDWQANDIAADSGNTRMFSVYKVNRTQAVWVITEVDRSATLVVLPEEYV